MSTASFRSQKPITIAIDGYSSTGKSTLAKQLAEALGIVYVDSGAMYRAVALHALRNGWIDAQGYSDNKSIISALDHLDISFVPGENGATATFLNGECVEQEIRTMKVSNVVSQVAALVPVRRKLVALQQSMGLEGGVVMDGRDIGTVVFPNAELKVFMTASDQVRAERRQQELAAKGQHYSWEEVLENLKSRDKTDMERADSPLLQDKDARILDNTSLDKEDQFKLVLSWVTQLQDAQQGA